MGAWVERNIDPAIYSRLLMRNAEKAAKGIEHSPDAPRKVLSVTHKETKVMVCHPAVLSPNLTHFCFLHCNQDESAEPVI